MHSLASEQSPNGARRHPHAPTDSRNRLAGFVELDDALPLSIRRAGRIVVRHLPPHFGRRTVRADGGGTRPHCPSRFAPATASKVTTRRCVGAGRLRDIEPRMGSPWTNLLSTSRSVGGRCRAFVTRGGGRAGA